MSDDFYDQLGAGYDSIINWEERLARETPFFRDLFARHDVRSVLDTACGTGEHAALFASWDLEVVATDISAEMIAVSRRKYEGQAITWLEAGFGSTFEVLGRPFDAVTCLGNSWPHVLVDADAERAAEDFARLVRPGGILILQQLNYEAMRLRGERLMGPQSRTIDGRENLFLRIFDLDRDPMRFTIVRMTREDDGWTREAWETEHRAWTAGELDALLRRAGFATVELFADFASTPFSSTESDQMIAVAERGDAE